MGSFSLLYQDYLSNIRPKVLGIITKILFVKKIKDNIKNE